MSKQQIIGIWNDYDDTKLITWDLLKIEIDSWKCRWTLDEYADRRVNTNLTRFNYDPFSGEKIDWDKLKEDAKR